jgi:ABC-type enterobactin transport system permease subunit
MQTKLTRELTRIERQAYEGAKDFYHITIPAAIVVGIVANVYIWYYDTARKEVVNENLVETVIEGGIAIISYLFALKYYHLCNAIDTAPISAGDSSL